MKKEKSGEKNVSLKQKIITLSSIMITSTLLLVGCNQANNTGSNNQAWQNSSYPANNQYYQYPQNYGQMQPLYNSNQQTTPNYGGSTSYGSGTYQQTTPSYGGGGYGQTGYSGLNNAWNNMWGNDYSTGDTGYYTDNSSDYNYGYGDYNTGYDYGSGAGDYYGGGYYSDYYANQTYQDIYENRAATNQEINDNTSQWLYDGTANYINPETGELEQHDYTEGNDWYQDYEGNQYQSDDSSYTPDYSTETQMEEYSGWASDYSASDYGYDSSYDSGSYDYGGYDE